MITIRAITLLVVAMMPIALQAQSGRMKQLSGPTGGANFAVSSSDNGTTYLATTTALYQRTLNGTGWEVIRTLPFWPDLTTVSILPFGNKLFLCNRSYGMVTADGSGMLLSNSWKGPCSDLAVSGNLVYSLGMDSIARTNELFRSNDSGLSWKMILRDSTMKCYYISQGIAGKLYMSGNGIYTNIRGDSVWRRIDPSPVRNWGKPFEVDSEICLAQPSSGLRSLFRTTNAGMTWDSVGNFGRVGSMARDSTGVIWIGTEKGVQLSRDSGRHWEEGHFLDVYGENASFCVSSENDVIMRTLNHVYRYDRNTFEWLMWEDSLISTNIMSLLSLSGDTLMSLCDGGFYRSSDGGFNWLQDSMDNHVFFGGSLFPANGSSNMKFIRDKEGNVYCSQFKYNRSLSRWLTLFDTVQDGRNNPDVVAADSAGYLYSTYTVNSSSSELLRSSDQGLTWKELPLTNYSWNEITCDPKGRLLACVTFMDWPHEASIIRSTDHGVTWDSLMGNSATRWWPPDDPQHVLVTKSGRMIAAYSGFDTMQNAFTMVASSDDGSSWQIASRTLSPSSFTEDEDSQLYLAGGYTDHPESVIMASRDGGNSWSLLSRSTDTNYSVVVVGKGKRLFAGSGNNGVLEYAPALATVESSKVVEKSNACLHLGRHTFVSCDLPDGFSSATITIYDLLGRVLTRELVAPILSQVRIPIASHSSGLAAGCVIEFSDGVHFVRSRITTISVE